MTPAYLGIDIAKQSFVCSLLQEGKPAHRTFGNHAEGLQALDQWLAKHKVSQLHACLEATNRYWEALAWHLQAQGYRVSVVNPARIHDYARSKLSRNKTDPLDADLIADFCATQQPPAWTPPSPEVRELQALVRHREALQAMRIQESNRLEAGAPSALVRQSLEAHLTYLDQQIADVEQSIQSHIDHHPALKRDRDLLTSIPGISDTTAAKLLSENIQSFTTTRELVAYAGLNPQWRNSGSSVRGRPQLSKIGRAGLRRALYLPALSAMRHNPLIIRFCARLEQKGKAKMVRVGAAMRKLLCLALGVLKSQVPFDPAFSPTMQAVS
jgi:transposase